MTTKELYEKFGFKVSHEASEREITSIFCGDLLSWAMGRCPEGSAWCTVMGNANTIAVASLADAACVILCHDAKPMEDTLEKAEQADINLFTTELPEFEAALAVYKALNA